VGVEHWVDAGTHTPAQAVPTHALGQVEGVPHCPSLPQICTVVFDAHRACPGMQTPLQAVPTHAYMHEAGGPHCPFIAHV
jgi:hypothetical protein